MSEDVSIADVAAGPSEALTPAQVLKAAYENAAAHREPKDIIIPGYGEPASELHVTFQMIDDYEDLRDSIRQALGRKNLRPAQREVALAIETLSAAAVGSYCYVNGQRVDIGQPLGLGLYEYLGHPGSDPDGVLASNDGQAITMLFHESTTLIMTAYMEFDQWMRRGGRDAEEEAVGES